MRDILKRELETNSIFTEQTEYALNSGKRIRSIIALSLALSGAKQHIALYVEYLHNADLLLGDLSAFNNNRIRRKAISFHIKYGEAIAIQEAQGLLFAANSELAMACNDHIILIKINGLLAAKTQFKYLTNIQLDKLSDRKRQEYGLKMAKVKTGTLFVILFMLSLQSSSIHSDASTDFKVSDASTLSTDFKVSESIGYSFGLCYQIVNDLKNRVADTKKNGAIKNICNYFTHNELIDVFSYNLEQFKEKATEIGIYNQLLSELYRYLLLSFKKLI